MSIVHEANPSFLFPSSTIEVISLTFQEETRLKLAQINRVRQLEEEKATIAEERDEIDAARQHMERVSLFVLLFPLVKVFPPKLCPF